MIYPPIGTDGDRSQGALDDVWAPVGVAAVLVDHEKRKPINITSKIICRFVRKSGRPTNWQFHITYLNIYLVIKSFSPWYSIYSYVTIRFHKTIISFAGETPQNHNCSCLITNPMILAGSTAFFDAWNHNFRGHLGWIGCLYAFVYICCNYLIDDEISIDPYDII
jgi:hypothetical protein